MYSPNWSGTIFCRFLQQTGSNSKLESMKLKKCKIVNGPMYERSAPKQYVCFLKGRSFLYKFYTVTICWPKLHILSTLQSGVNVGPTFINLGPFFQTLQPY